MLPKSYIPSAVPLFTARKDEIEEIRNIITGESTRLLNIWGSPGFGKTSTAVEVARHLSSLGFPVYFFKLLGIRTVDEILSKILSIFKSNLVDFNLRPIDKVVSIFREISSRIIFVFDNLDDLLSSESSYAKLTRLIEELLDSNVNINIIFTTRELLENMRDVTKGFQDIRIRPLHPVSSVEFVRQLLPSSSENVVATVARISSHVPLAMKIIASLVEGKTEDMANEILEEISLSENLLEKIDSPYEKNMKRLFAIPFEQLLFIVKHALISLSVFPFSTISQDAAIDVVSREMGFAKAVQSLKILAKKSLIDEDSCREYYSFHPLIHSFVLEKAKKSDFENVFQSSRIRFCRYYFLLFERMNDDFLSGKPVDIPQVQDVMQHLWIAYAHQSTTSSLENFQHLFRILSKSEIFFFLIALPSSASVDVGCPMRAVVDIPKLYDWAIEKCRTQQSNDAYLKLHVSKYFQSISFPSFALSQYSEIPQHIREDVMLLSDGSAAKLCCYEGISLISKGNMKSGIECIEKYLDGLKNCADQYLIKCLCLQLLALFYTDLKEYSKASKLRQEAIEVCEEIGNYNLFLIGECEQTSSVTHKEYKGEQLILFVHLLFMWSKQILNKETQLYFFNFVNQLEEQLENKAYNAPQYFYQIFTYGDGVSAYLGIGVGQEVLLKEKISFLQKSAVSDDSCSLTDTTFSTRSEVSASWSSERLLHCYNIQMIRDSNEISPNVNTCRDALNLSLKQYGKQHWNTAFCYLKMGLAEHAAENYISALNAFDQALEIMTASHDGSSRSNATLDEVYIGKGKSYICINKFEPAIASFEEALRIRRKLYNEDTEEIAQVLVSLGHSQWRFNDLSSCLAPLEQALEIRKKLYAEKPCPYGYRSVVECYLIMGNVHFSLGNNTESIKCLQTALEVKNCNHDCSFEHGLICFQLINLNADENLYMKLLDSVLPAMKENYRSFLPILYLRLGVRQVQLGKYNAGLAFVQEALDIELEITLESNFAVRDLTVSSLIEMVAILNNIGKFKLARKVIDRAIQIAESLPECGQHRRILECYGWKGRIENGMQEYLIAIKSFKHALLQVRKIYDESCDIFEEFVKKEEFVCQSAMATAYLDVGSYTDALTSFYDALSVIKDLLPEGSEREAKVYLSVVEVAQKMKNQTLVVTNLRFAYKMYSKILGKTHPQAELIYLAYARALIGSG